MSGERILVTGHLGYVGAALLPWLRARRPDATLIGFDAGYFVGALTGPPPEALLDAQRIGDLRAVPADLLRGIDVVVHLAAISNDPMGEEFAAVTHDVNHAASVALARAAARAGVKSFVFASSTSMYGAADGPPRREDDPKAPLTAYARSKLSVEEALRTLDAPEMRFSSLRFATACGMSPRLRLDLMLNDFVAGALSTGEITVLSDGTPWRPLIDVADMARAIDWAISRPRERGGAFLAVNVGRDDHNVQVRDVAHAVADLMPGTRVSINAAAAPDRRSYRVDFGLFARLAPEAVPLITLPESIERLRVGLEPLLRSDGGFDRGLLVRLAALRRHLAAGRLGRDLRWVRAA